jgi:hypothetical protein
MRADLDPRPRPDRGGDPLSRARSGVTHRLARQTAITVQGRTARSRPPQGFRAANGRRRAQFQSQRGKPPRPTARPTATFSARRADASPLPIPKHADAEKRPPSVTRTPIPRRNHAKPEERRGLRSTSPGACRRRPSRPRSVAARLPR